MRRPEASSRCSWRMWSGMQSPTLSMLVVRQWQHLMLSMPSRGRAGLCTDLEDNSFIPPIQHLVILITTTLSPIIQHKTFKLCLFSIFWWWLQTRFLQWKMVVMFVELDCIRSIKPSKAAVLTLWCSLLLMYYAVHIVVLYFNCQLHTFAQTNRRTACLFACSCKGVAWEPNIAGRCHTW